MSVNGPRTREHLGKEIQGKSRWTHEKRVVAIQDGIFLTCKGAGIGQLSAAKELHGKMAEAAVIGSGYLFSVKKSAWQN